MKLDIAKYVGTKFILAVLGMGSAFYLVLAGHAEHLGTYTGVLATVLGFYNAGNVISDYIAAKHRAKQTGEN